MREHTFWHYIFYLLLKWVFVIIQVYISVLILIIPHLYTISPISKVNRRNWIFYPQIMNVLFMFQGQTGGVFLFLILIFFLKHYFPFQVAWKFEINFLDSQAKNSLLCNLSLNVSFSNTTKSESSSLSFLANIRFKIQFIILHFILVLNLHCKMCCACPCAWAMDILRY